MPEVALRAAREAAPATARWFARSCSVVVAGVLAACGAVSRPSDEGASDAAPASAGPALHWALDGTLDSAGALRGFALTVPGGVEFVPGKVGSAARFADGQLAQVSGMRAALATSPEVTIAFWLRAPGSLRHQRVLDFINASAAPYGGLTLSVTGPGVALCVATASAATLGACTTAWTPSADTWHHWIVRYDGRGLGAGEGGAIELYIDGALAGVQANDAANDPVWNPGMPDVLALQVANTQLDDVRVYDRVMTMAEQCTELIGGTWDGRCALP